MSEISKVLQNLNDPQRDAVLHTQGPLLVFAGAGSGKTKVITTRIAYLIANNNVSPDRILAVTFTKKAAEEMRERVLNLLSTLGADTEDMPVIGTFHSLGAMILRENAKELGYTSNFSIYDTDDADNLIKDIMVSQNIDIKQIKPQAVSWLIGSAKNDLVSPEELPYKYSGYIEDLTGEIYAEYQKQLKAQNSMDFGDLIYLSSKLLDENDEVLTKYQNRFEYLMVDEYQDTNRAQYIFAKRLAQKHRNIAVVGDDDQGIYAWRGADIRNILSFEKDFPEVKIVKLEQNYRSVGNVITAAVSVIQRNSQRASKELWTAQGDGEKITIYQARDPDDEAKFVVDEALSYVRRNGKALKDCAILYRTNFQSRILEEELLSRGMSYKLVGGYRFYERKEIKDIISYLRYIHNIKDDLSITRVINIPSRKVGPKGIATLHEIARGNDLSVGQLLVGTYLSMHSQQLRGIDPYIIERCAGLLDQMDKFKGIVEVFGGIYVQASDSNISEAINTILDRTNYIDWLNDGSEQAQSRIENIEELKNVAQAYTQKSSDKSIALFLQGLTLMEQEQDNSRDDGTNSITLMTIHSAKGLEFPAVFMVGMEEGVFPNSRALNEDGDVEEERRLCYVGITRARERLWMTFSEGRVVRGGYSSQVPSRFLSEIPTDLCEYYSWNN